MPGLEFSVPYNASLPEASGRLEVLEEVFKLKNVGNNKIREIYLSAPQEYSGSGRIAPKTEFTEFLEAVNRIHREGIRVNLTMNPTCEGTDWYSPSFFNKTIEFLKKVHGEYGIEAVTLANPIYIKEIKDMFPNLEVGASVLGDIDCVQRAVFYNKLGADVIVPDVNINRNISLLKKIKKACNAEIKLMVNEGCLYKCPFRKFHFNFISHASKVSNGTDYFVYYCHKFIKEDLSQILKSGWIRPEDLKEYEEVTKYFKIVGRLLPKSKTIRTDRAYLEERWNGDLLDIMCSSIGAFSMMYGASLDNRILDECEFFRKVTSCEQNCSECNYCKELAKKIIRLGHLTKERIEDKR
jgi:collagenase-like PrtC family protease